MDKRILAAILVLVAFGSAGYMCLRWGPAWRADRKNANREGVSPAAATIEYANRAYGFSFSLPRNWLGYSVVVEKWEGVSSDTSDGSRVESGPLLLIRNPLWSDENPSQDIPILIFTTAQWNALSKDAFHVGAAPINPTELGRNSRYVFALPARYNFAFLPGWEEVDQILQTNPLRVSDDRTRQFFGLIRKVEGNTLVIDEVEFLSGEEARRLAAEDTDCPISKVEECVPSLNNDFYIRNKDTHVQVYVLGQSVSVSILPNPGSPDLASTSVASFLREFPRIGIALPFMFEQENGLIVSAVEQYTP